MINYIIVFRSNDDSYSRGVLTDKAYIRGKKRSIVSLQMCFMGWLYELLAMISAIIAPFLHNFGIPNTHWIDPIAMFVAIPLCHLMNDEQTKGIIGEENWYEGIRHMLGIYIEKPQKQVSLQPPTPKNNPPESHCISSRHRTFTTLSQNKVLRRKYNSASNLFPLPTSEYQKVDLFRRRHSFPEHVVEP